MDWSRRSEAAEWMDDPAVGEAELAACLHDLARVNRVTLAMPPTVWFLRRAAQRAGRRLSVLDVGSGGGDMLRRLARWRARTGVSLRLEGVDLNPASERIARAATPDRMGISYRTGDVREMAPGSVDVVISSLVTHHMRDGEVVAFLRWMERTARVGWFVNDLHRHPVAYWGFRALAGVAGWHPMVRHDGAVSVTRAFQRGEWDRLLREAGLERVARVRWHVPFRYSVGRLK